MSDLGLRPTLLLRSRAKSLLFGFAFSETQLRFHAQLTFHGRKVTENGTFSVSFARETDFLRKSPGAGAPGGQLTCVEHAGCQASMPGNFRMEAKVSAGRAGRTALCGSTGPPATAERRLAHMREINAKCILH